MPKRPRSHIIGETAILAFRSLVPDAWVVREKTSDYGVDLEVELFTVSGLDTGLTLNVQSKGTEIDTKTNSISIKTATLRYLCSLDSPAIIFRHNSKTKKSYLMWASEALAISKAKETKTTTIHFVDRHLWTHDTPSRLQRALSSIRLIRDRSPQMRLPINYPTGLSDDAKLIHRQALDIVTSKLPFTDSRLGDDGIYLLFRIENGVMYLSVPDLLSLSAYIDLQEPSRYVDCLAYLLAKLCFDLHFDQQAERTAILCSSMALAPPNRELLYSAALSLLGKPDRAVEFALRNGLSQTIDQYTNLFGATLQSKVRSIDSDPSDVIRFYKSTIDNASDKEHASAIAYSLGNYLRSIQRHPEAVRYYNFARTHDSTYLDRSYFYKEIGGLFYMRKHRRCAARAYGRLVSMEDTPNARLLLGDAFLYQKQYNEAMNAFRPALSDPTSIGAEVSLKYMVASWASESNIVDDITDPTIILSNRNRSLAEQNLNEIIMWQTILSFHSEDDEHCWSDLIYLCIRTSDTDLLVCALKCALRRCGIYVHQKFIKDHGHIFSPSELTSVSVVFQDVKDEVAKEPPYNPGESNGELRSLEERGVIRVVPDGRI